MRLVPVLLAGLLLAVACAAPQAQTTAIVATLSDKAITLDPASVPAGPVKFTVVNGGTIVHSMVLLKTDRPHDQIPADAKDPAKVDETGVLRATGQMAVGETKEFSVLLAAGSYVLVCNEPAHYIVGMHAPLSVR